MPPHVMSSTTDEAAAASGLAHDLVLAEYIHRCANDFAVACAEVHVAGREATLERARDRLGVVVDRLYALTQIQRLLQPPRAATIDLGPALTELCRHHAQARFAEQGVFVHLRAAEVQVDASRGWALLMIVSELLTNAARHAFGAPGGLVKVDTMRIGDDLVCLVADDGVGIARNQARARAGTAIVAALARQADIALVSREGRVGTLFELRMPIRS
jgi:two-component sensor histidine kinase